MNHKLFSEIINNSDPLNINEIPVLEYEEFYDRISVKLDNENVHCVAYYGVNESDDLRFLCCLADDSSKNVNVYSYRGKKNASVKSLTPVCPQLHIFEREINENFGVEFEGHPWLKPVRYPHDRQDKSKIMDNYPFYAIESEELHEVGVGPIHAGVIEPGHFRFICNGEKVLHLEIHLGYQHRGIEKLMVESQNQLQRCILSESIAGDSSVAHGLAHSQLIESIAGLVVSERLQAERIIALELERIAVHIGDTAALCGDVAYQLGQVACEALRTRIINLTQFWCGNRFGKGLIRPGCSNYPLNENTCEEIVKTVRETAGRFEEVAELIYSLPSVLARFDEIGIVTKQQSQRIGSVGMAARSSGLERDIRKTHPFQIFKQFQMQPVVIETGDVMSRGTLRRLEVQESAKMILEMVEIWRNKAESLSRPDYGYILKPGTFGLSLVEGWRGEICHSAITDDNGRIVHYKIKDPSFHNWMALALAVRNQEISDFPVCNKSFNLSYCGNDL